MDKKVQILVGVLLLVVAFLGGSTVAKSKYGPSSAEAPAGKQGTPTSAPVVPTQAPFVPTKKSDKPEIKFFVMSFCPYGNQAEDGIEPVYQLLKNKVTFSPRYIINDQKSSCVQNCPFKVYNDDAKKRCEDGIKQGQVKDLETCKTYFPYTSADECLKKECDSLKAGTYESLHGVQELNQDIREICAYNLGNLDKWWKFVAGVNKNCTAQNVDTCWTDQAKTAGLNTNKIAQCEKTQGNALTLKEIAESTKAQASGSPTVLINDTLYNGGRAPEDYKKAICASFNSPPKECETSLGAESAATSGGCN